MAQASTAVARIAPPTEVSAGPRLIGGRFRVAQLLTQNFGAETFLATDLERQAAVVVKTTAWASLSPGALMRLEHEAAWLRRVESPFFARLLDAGRDGDDFFLVLEYIPGVPLQTRLEAGPLSLEETLLVGRALLSALGDIHQQGVLHRGVRPSNVIVNPDGPINRATLVDFGPARIIQPDAPLRSHPLEAALYLSPEQAGSIDHDVAEASDIYAAGVVLYHALAGHPPFSGDSIGAILFAHMTAAAPGLRESGVMVPRALDELVSRLLQKDPRDRYQSAKAVLADLEAIVGGLQDGQSEPAVVIGASDRRGTLTEPAFVARMDELGELDEQIRRARDGEGGLVLLEGESGGGKTRLLCEMAQRGVRHGLWVLRGSGTTEVAQHPFQLLDGIVHGFLSACQANPGLAQSMRQRLGLYAQAVSAALPGLGGVLNGDAAGSLGPEEAGETRTIQALASFLDALGSAARPVLIILDDCQWADELTCRLIGHWQARAMETGQEPRHVLLVVAFRTEEVPQDHRLRRAGRSAHLRLSPFTPGQVRQLVESMAGHLPEEAINVVIRLAEGSPFMASAVLRGLLECGALVAGPDGWFVETQAMASAGSSSRAATFLARRLELLPGETTALLSSGAVLGKQFDLDMAAQLGQQTASQAIAAVDEARQRRLVWLRPDGASCVFVHDKVRSALLERLETPRRQYLHRQAAAFLQERAPERVSELAYHFDAAGDSPSALPYALRAAEQARTQHALEIAEQQYRIAARGAQQAEVAARYQIAEGLGDVLLLRGRYDVAGELFESAAALAEGTLAQAQIQGKLGELAFKRGDMQRAIQRFETALRLLGRYVPGRRRVALPLLIWEIMVQAAHTCFPSWFVHRRKQAPTEGERLTLRLFSNLAHGCWYCPGTILGVWAHLRGLNLAERYPPTRELAQAYAEHAPGMSLIGVFDRGIRYVEKSLAMRKELDDLWGQGASLVMYGITLYAASRFTECVQRCREAIRLLERLGDYWQIHMARYQLAASLYHLGDLAGAVHEARLNYRSGLERGDEQASGIILDVWARAAGALPDRILSSELKRSRHDAQGIAQMALAQAVCLLEAGQASKAAEVLEMAIGIMRRQALANAYTLPNLAWAATAYRQLAEQTLDLTPNRRQAVLRRAETAARRAIRTSWLCRNDLPHALRELALILAMQGKNTKAKLLFRRSLEVAEKQGERGQYAQTLLAYNRVGRERGWPEQPIPAAADPALAAALPSGPGALHRTAAIGDARSNISLVDRFDTLIDSGRKIASTSTPAAVYEEARLAALRLLRGERCLVLGIQPSGASPQFVLLAGEAGSAFSEAILWRAIQAGRAVAGVEELASQAAGSGGEFSAIAAPIHVRGHAAACLYATHSQVRGLFGPDEERLADFIATLAGAALENAEAFTQLQCLNETLEGRVTERTAAAEARARELAVSNRELARVASELRQTEEQLHVAIDAAEAANRAKSRFLATMSHEIRTPMNGILGMAELTSRTPLTPQQQSYLNIVKQSGEALLTILNDVLDFSKIEAGRMELERIPFEPREVVVDAAQVFAMSASQKGLDLVCRIAPDVPAEIVGDPGRLRQILVNLIGNALKFTERGEIFVDAWVEPGAGALRFSVKDTGIGIPADKQACIFDAFRQSDSSTTRRFGGTGLGLSISSQLVGLMGGRIWLESEPGQGSAFHFQITLALPEQTATPLSVPDVLRGVKTLILARRPSVRRVFRELLKSWDMLPATTENPILALSALRSAVKAGTPFRLVLIDVDAADRHSWSLIEAIRRDPQQQSCAIVLLIAPTHPDHSDRCRQLAIRHCLPRPPKHAELLSALASALGAPDAYDQQAPAAAIEHPLRILLAEDGPVNQEVAVGLLKLRGHEVDVVANGREALEALDRQTFDAVLMDVEMPEMDGLEATTLLRLRERATGQHMPVIAMTAHAVKGFRERCLEAGMDDYISKPIKPDELYRAVESAAKSASLVSR